MTNQLTKLEAAALNHYAFDEMNPGNGARPENADDVCCYVWADQLAVALGVSVNAAKGVISSLVKKELAYVTEEDDDNGFGFLAAGFEAWAAAFPVKEKTPQHFTVNTIEISASGNFIHTALKGVFNNEGDAQKCFDEVIAKQIGKFEKAFDASAHRTIFTDAEGRKLITEILIA